MKEEEIKKIMDQIKDEDMLKDIIHLLPEKIFESDAHANFQIGLEDLIEIYIRAFFNESD